jgi:micrococcal nuclease
MDWASVTNRNTPDFSFDGDTIVAKVLSVYDGDTIKVAFPLEGKMFRWNCRLSGVDTPELRTKNLKEKEFGYEVRDALREKILDRMVTLKCGEFDKYGRLLVEVIIDDESVNTWLISNNYAFAYDGGTKRVWFEEYS